MTGSEIRKRSFAPVTDAQVRLLILGSLPGEKSLQASQYYANRSNRFWHLTGAVLGIDLVALPYQARLAALLARHVGLWDVIADAERNGSLDSRIRNPRANGLGALLDALPRLETIAFNGGTAARIGLAELGDRAVDYRIVRLPSSSGAAAMKADAKLAAWMALRTGLHSGA